MSAEQAIRNYLRFLDDPSSMRDDAEIARLEAAAEATEDPIEKLRLLSEAQRAREVDGSPLEAEFVAHSRHWADVEGVTPEAFRSLGVPNHVLAAAGLAKASKGSRASKSASLKAPKQKRAPAVSADAVVDSIPEGPFSVRDLMEASGASLQTVRKAVRRMLTVGELVDLGLDPNWDGRGRTPTLYRKSTSGG